MHFDIPEGTITVTGGEWEFWNHAFSIRNHAFSITRSWLKWKMEKKNLKTIYIPKSVTCLGDGAFDRCFSLEVVIIPPSVTAIADHAFNGCWSLVSLLYICLVYFLFFFFFFFFFFSFLFFSLR